MATPFFQTSLCKNWVLKWLPVIFLESLCAERQAGPGPTPPPPQPATPASQNGPALNEDSLKGKEGFHAIV